MIKKKQEGVQKVNKKEKKLFELLKKYAFNVISKPKGKLKYSFVEPGPAYHNTL